MTNYQFDTNKFIEILMGKKSRLGEGFCLFVCFFQERERDYTLSQKDCTMKKNNNNKKSQFLNVWIMEVFKRIKNYFILFYYISWRYIPTYSKRWYFCKTNLGSVQDLKVFNVLFCTYEQVIKHSLFTFISTVYMTDLNHRKHLNHTFQINLSPSPHFTVISWSLLHFY